MDKIHTVIHKISEQLFEVKEMFDSPNLDRIYEYYEKELYNKPYLDEVTYQVNELFEVMMIDILTPIKCSIRRDNNDSQVPSFTIKSEMIGDFATVELYESVVVISRSHFSNILKDREIDSLVKYTNYLEKFSIILKEHRFVVRFN